MMGKMLVHTILLSMLMAQVSAAQFQVEIIPPDQWGAQDDALGLVPGLVEDFEDTELQDGLAFEISDAAGNFSGNLVTTLPNIFDPVGGDPYGNSFAAGVWDGSHVLVNTLDNQSQNYGSQDWRPVSFHVPEGARWVALATQQVTVNHSLYVNGASQGRLSTLGFELGTGPNGMIVVRSEEDSNPVFSVSFGGMGDAFVVDHIVFQTAASVPAEALSWGHVKSLFR